MAKATRTLNPLHFQDLEPHRFEDLVRQLVYEFRPWHSLEATGRLGSDDGVDIRGTERVVVAPQAYDDEEESEAETETLRAEREWRIQCKRERRLGPSAVRKIADDILGETPVPHGVIVAASCDFSKKARDAFRAKMAEAGVEEFYLWGQAELEDALFRPANDHLLWAYFGISLRVRRASRSAAIRSRLATKRRLVKVIGGVDRDPHAYDVMIRDAEASEYPWPDNPDDFIKAPRWRYVQCEGHLSPDHLGFVSHRHYAWWDQTSDRFDAVLDVDTAWPRRPELVGINPPDETKDEHVRRFWVVRVPEAHQAQVIEIGLIHYDQILAIDEFGDRYHPGIHLLIDFEGRTNPFRRTVGIVRHYGYGGQSEARLSDLELEPFFPHPIPEISNEEWTAYFEAKKP